MDSALYFGVLRHRRFTPVAHEFAYPLWMAWLDLSELDRVFHERWLWSTRRPALAWFRRADYLGEAHVPLDEAVRAKVFGATGQWPDGPVRMLAHLRTFGHCFNPVTFYYCYDARGERVRWIVADITNTPWKERHAYVLAADDALPLRHRFAKRFHVSPFMPMEMEYDWRFPAPGERLAVHMANLLGGQRVFDATLVLRRREITFTTLSAALLAHPPQALNVVRAIYWQALRLRLKRVPFHAHPPPRSGKVSA
jgi:uncharacterized protein